MNSRYHVLCILIITSVMFMPVKSFWELNESKSTQIVVLTQNSTCPNHLSTNLSCATSAPIFWLQTESDLLPESMRLILAGLLSFILLFSRYKSPSAELFRPPIAY